MNTNELLKDLAHDAVKNIRSTRILLDFDLTVSLGPAHYNALLVRIGCRKPSFSGDHTFRLFDISDVLLPDRADLTVRLQSKTDSFSYREIILPDLPLAWNDSLNLVPGVTFPELNGDSASLSDISLHYSDEALHRVNERLDLIHDYHASGAVTDSLQLMVNAMNIKDEMHYPEYFVKLCEIGRMNDIMGEKSFVSILQLDRYDPKDFARRYLELFRTSKSAIMNYLDHLDEVGQIGPVISADSGVSLFFAGLMRYINWSLLVNDRNGNIYKEYLDTYYERSAFTDDLKALRRLLSKTTPGLDSDSSLSLIFHKIHEGYRTLARDLVKSNRFSEAMILLDNSRHFSVYDPFPEAVKPETGVVEEAANGVYAAFLGIAESSIRQRKLDMGVKYMAKAKEYRDANSASLKSDSLYGAVFMLLLNQQVKACDSFSAEKKYQECLECFQYFESGFDSLTRAILVPHIRQHKERAYNGLVETELVRSEVFRREGDADSALYFFESARRLIPFTGNLNHWNSVVAAATPAFDSLRYLFLIRRGGDQFRRRNYPASYVSISAAGEIARLYSYSSDPLLDSLNHLIFPRNLECQIMMAQKRIWMGMIREAEAYADSVSGVQRLQGCEADSSLSATIARFRARIHEKRCSDAREAIETYALRAQHYLERARFIQAGILLDSALVVENSNPLCALATGEIRDTLARYLDAVSFQKMEVATENFLSLHQYMEAIKQCKEEQEFYTRKSIARFGIPIRGLSRLIREKSDPELTWSAARNYLAQNMLNDALDALKLYDYQGGEMKRTREFQISLGKTLAGHDFRVTKDPLSLVEGYTEHNPHLSVFERSYQTQWNILLKNDVNRNGSGGPTPDSSKRK